MEDGGESGSGPEVQIEVSGDDFELDSDSELIDRQAISELKWLNFRI